MGAPPLRQIGAFEAKNRLSELLVAVENGEEVTITKHGRPVAKLVPFTAHDQARVAAAIAELRELREKVRLGAGETVKDLINEGRRD
jgi:prevent-host-death family protein